MIDSGRLSRAQGCLLGQLAGDALGSLVEFRSPEYIAARYPGGVRDMADGGAWDTLAGQPTDDSEMALMLARFLASPKGKRGYNAKAVRERYLYWLDSEPFDCGATVQRGLEGDPNPESQANGALMRISPLGIYGARFPDGAVANWAMEDAALTHPHPVCRQVNALFAIAVARTVREETTSQGLVDQLFRWTKKMSPPVAPEVFAAMTDALREPPVCYGRNAGWALKAFQNALYELLHTPGLEQAVVNTIGRGGDTDTNAAVCGALFGAVYGVDAIPSRWADAVLHCRPREGDPGVRHPRPECFWPVDALELAAGLMDPRPSDGSLRRVRERVQELFGLRKGGEGGEASPPPEKGGTAEPSAGERIFRFRELLEEMRDILRRNGEDGWLGTIDHCLACIGEDAERPGFPGGNDFPGVREAIRTCRGIHGAGLADIRFVNSRGVSCRSERAAFLRVKEMIDTLLREWDGDAGGGGNTF